ncbi:transposase protein [Holotrichia oblita]|uniref:Transposase protein n=1 Tax=Holotrichia oblita TaxID=644536 RepID=A0ACB9SKR9_HOLOL|nr:transposase protein [Holotrichia oblita]
MKEEEKICMLLFDEMSLSSQLTYTYPLDIVQGFEDDGERRTQDIADHVQVFMLRGVFKKWKLPVAFNFSKSSTNAATIVKLYKDIVKKANAVGLKVIASVCDQGSTNMRAVRMLQEETRANALRGNITSVDDTINIDGQVIVHLYDPTHMLKCLRNNLLIKPLKFTEDGVTKVAKWEHLIDAYCIDSSAVSMCSQVFSKSVAAAVNLMSRNNCQTVDKTKTMPSEGQQTANLFLFLDDLFDSVNGGMTIYKPGKTLRGPVTPTSRHNYIWSRAIAIFENMEYIPIKPGDKSRPAVLQSWIETLKGFKVIRHRLFQKGYKNFPARAFNQDALENFFGQIRQHDMRNINPSCNTFTQYYKTLLVNNFVSYKSRNFNCEDDECSNLLTDVRTFISQKQENGREKIPELTEYPAIPRRFLLRSDIELFAIAYISG